MAERAFDRAFSRAAAASDVTGAEAYTRPKAKAVKPVQEVVEEATPMQRSDAIQRILKAHEDKDYIRYTGLPNSAIVAHTCSSPLQACHGSATGRCAG